MLWIAQSNLNFVIGVVGTEFTQSYAIGDHLYHLANISNIDPKHRRMGTINHHLPLNTRQRQCIFNISNTFDIEFYPVANLCGSLIHQFAIWRGNLDLNILTHWRPSLDLFTGDIDTGHIGSAPTDFGKNFKTAALALTTGIEFHQKRTDFVAARISLEGYGITFTKAIELLDAWNSADALLNFSGNLALLFNGKIALSAHIDHAIAVFNIGKERLTGTKFSIAPEYRQQEEYCDHRGDCRTGNNRL